MPATNSASILSIVNHTETKSDNERSIEFEISRTLKKLGIRTKFIGYNYLKTAIILYYQKPDEYYFITKCLYPEVAKIYNVNTAAIERAMRTAISAMNSSDATKEQIIGYASNSYTNKEIITCIAEYVAYL